jgi:hypothetical protein
VQYNAMDGLPPKGAKLPLPSVGVDVNGQRGWCGMHWIPWGDPNAE